MATFSIVISASAVDSALADEVVRVSTLSVGTTVNSAIFTADTGSGADVWASSDKAGTSRIGLGLVYWDDSASEFAVDIAAASLSSVSDTTVYLQVGSKPAGDVDPYPSTAEGFWPLMADFNDDTTNGNDGTANGGVTAGGVTGPDGVLPATDFDGTDDYITTGNAVVATTPISISMWAQYPGLLTSASGGTKHHRAVVISNKFSSSVRTSFGYETGADDVRYNPNDGSNSQVNATLPATTAGVWYHIAVTDTGTAQSVYIDGVEDATGTTPLSFTTLNETCIGAWFKTAGIQEPYDNPLAQIGIHSAARPAASINLEYLLTGANAATYITAAEVATFNPAWALNSNVLIGAA